MKFSSVIIVNDVVNTTHVVPLYTSKPFEVELYRNIPCESVPPVELGLWALVPTGNKIESVEFICSFAPRTAVADVADPPIINWSYVALGFAHSNVVSVTP